jgi:hypothetical protein
MSEVGSGTSARRKAGSGLKMDLSARGKSHPKSVTEARMKQVLTLNQMGKSNGAIARELKCATKTVRRDLRLLLKQGFRTINLYQRRQNGKWWNAIEGIIKELPYFTSRSIKPSVRTMFYRLESRGYIEKTERDYDNLVAHTVSARLGKIDGNTGKPLYPKLPINCFADETRRLIDNHSDYEPTGVQDPDEYIDELIGAVKEGPEAYDGTGSTGGHWYNQPEYVEVWIEKQALAPTFESFLEYRYVNSVVNKGYSSLTFLWENTQRLKEKISKFGLEHVHVLYFGDFDPSGEDMDRSIKDYFEIFGVSSEIFERVALTPEQINEYGIPSRPIKPGDSRNASFKDKYGEEVEASEIDAFFATKPKEFEDLVQKSVDDYYDQKIYDDLKEKYGKKPTSDELRQIHREMFDKITDAFSPGWDEDYAAEIAYDDNEDEEEEE